MRQVSIAKVDNFDWFQYKSNIIGVREKNSGGFAIKPKQIGSVSSFKVLIEKIIKYYRFQYLTFDSRGVTQKYLDELTLPASLLLLPKPYVGKYEKGKIKAILTNIKYHPRGVKVVLDDKNSTIGRIATIVKKNHL